MFTQSIPHQCRAVAFRPDGRTVSCLQQLFVENDLNGFHVSNLIHSIVHSRRRTRLPSSRSPDLRSVGPRCERITPLGQRSDSDAVKVTPEIRR